MILGGAVSGLAKTLEIFKPREMCSVQKSYFMLFATERAVVNDSVR
jgi:hypothetical protein